MLKSIFDCFQNTVKNAFNGHCAGQLRLLKHEPTWK